MLYINNKLSDLATSTAIRKELEAAYPYAFGENAQPIIIRYGEGMEMNVATDKGNIIPQRPQMVPILTKKDQALNLTSKNREVVDVIFTETQARFNEKTGLIVPTTRHKYVNFGQELHVDKGGLDYEFLIFLHFFSDQFVGGHEDKDLRQSGQTIIAYNQDVAAKDELAVMKEINNIKAKLLSSAEEKLRTLAQTLPGVNHDASLPVLQLALSKLVDNDADARAKIKKFLGEELTEETKEKITTDTIIVTAINEGRIQQDDSGVFVYLPGNDKHMLLEGKQNVEDPATLKKLATIYDKSPALVKKTIAGEK